LERDLNLFDKYLALIVWTEKILRRPKPFGDGCLLYSLDTQSTLSLKLLERA